MRREVLLLDLPSDEGPRDAIAAGHLKKSLKGKPSPIYSKRFAARIETGNFDDDLSKIAECDWILEVVVERLDIKQQLFEKVEQHRRPGTYITSNTSGIPMAMLVEGRSDDFKAHFCGTHFFNPPRYLQLLEIIPAPDTRQEVVDFFMAYGEKILGKQTVLCKDTPAFIANRVGVFAIQALFHTVQDMGLSVEAVDKLTGPAMGRPKSATFRTCDVVGIDTLGARRQWRGPKLPRRRACGSLWHPFVCPAPGRQGPLGQQVGPRASTRRSSKTARRKSTPWTSRRWNTSPSKKSSSPPSTPPNRWTT